MTSLRSSRPRRSFLHPPAAQNPTRPSCWPTWPYDCVHRGRAGGTTRSRGYPLTGPSEGSP